MDYIVRMYKDWKTNAQFHHHQFHVIGSEDEDYDHNEHNDRNDCNDVNGNNDMEERDDYCFAERQSIRDSGRSLKKYGSTCNHVRNDEHLVRHELATTDTLQGIALKYGCTTEQIRRTNRLFAQDSLFLRQFLMIPVDRNSPFYPAKDGEMVTETTAQRPTSLVDGVDTLDGSTAALSAADGRRDGSSNGRPSTDNQAGVAGGVLLSPEEESRKDIDAFLGKIDSTLAQTRKFVARSQNSFDYESSISSTPSASTSSSLSSYQQHRPNTLGQHQSHHHYQQHQRNSSSGSVGGNNNNHHTSSDTIELISMTSQSRRVRNSVQRLEKQRDDLFDL